MPFGPLGLSLAPWIRSRPAVYRWFKPFANWYANAAGYRKVGLKYDDLLVVERPDVQRALGRLTPREQYDRSFRYKRATQMDVIHHDLPKEQWTKPEEDIRYLKPHVESVHAEDLERAAWDNMTVQRRK
ncbi:hypothetical protein EIP86_000515 [Pleurotus ostreatoroseus]|nr:hypothetical protein EIP86_000515 [Pleurotus ostreatoroseus]